MTYEQILVEHRGLVGVIRLNRPEKLNARVSSTLHAQVRRRSAGPLNHDFWRLSKRDRFAHQE